MAAETPLLGCQKTPTAAPSAKLEAPRIPCKNAAVDRKRLLPISLIVPEGAALQTRKPLPDGRGSFDSSSEELYNFSKLQVDALQH